MKVKISSIFSDLQVKDFFLGLFVLLITGSIIDTLEWNGSQEIFYGSAPDMYENQKLYERVRLLEQELQILQYNSVSQ